MNKMYRKRILAASLLVATLLMGCSNQDANVTEKKKEKENVQKELQTVKIAVHVPLTGNSSIHGNSIYGGVQLALKEKEDFFKNMGIDLKLVVKDDQSDPNVGLKNAHDIVSDPEIIAMIGNFNSGVVRESLPVYEQAHLPVVGSGSSAVDLTKEGGVFQRLNAHDNLQGEAAAKYIKNELSLDNVYVVSDTSYYSKEISDIFTENAAKLGLTIKGSKTVEETETDFSSLINEIIQTKTEMVYFPGTYEQFGTFVKEAVQSGYTGLFFSSDSADAPELLDFAGKNNVSKVYISGLAGDLTITSDGEKFVEQFKKNNGGKTPGNLASFGYDCTLVVLNAIEKAYKENHNTVPTRENVLKEIRNTKDFKGRFTRVTFDKKGENVDSDIYIFNFPEPTYPGVTVGVVSSDEGNE